MTVCAPTVINAVRDKRQILEKTTLQAYT